MRRRTISLALYAASGLLDPVPVEMEKQAARGHLAHAIANPDRNAIQYAVSRAIALGCLHSS